MEKIKIYAYSIIWFLLMKIKYRKQLKCKLLNGIDGAVKLNIRKGSSLCIKGKFYCDGPIYFKADNNGVIVIGEGTYFNRNVSVTALQSVHIGNSCMFGNNVVIVDHNHVIKDGKLLNEFVTNKIEIGDNVWIGANTTITAGVSIGSNTIIGANSVVTNSIPEGVLAAGTPARVIKEL